MILKYLPNFKFIDYQLCVASISINLVVNDFACDIHVLKIIWEVFIFSIPEIFV